MGDRSAFSNWFRTTYKNDFDKGAEYLLDCSMFGGSDSVVWDYLKKTGDKHYSFETFIKATTIIMEEEDNA